MIRVARDHVSPIAQVYPLHGQSVDLGNAVRMLSNALQAGGIAIQCDDEFNPRIEVRTKKYNDCIYDILLFKGSKAEICRLRRFITALSLPGYFVRAETGSLLQYISSPPQLHQVPPSVLDLIQGTNDQKARHRIAMAYALGEEDIAKLRKCMHHPRRDLAIAHDMGTNGTYPSMSDALELLFA